MSDLIALATAHGAFLNEGGHGIPAGTLITFEPAELEAFAAALAARPATPPAEAWGRLYDAASKLIVAIGYHGERSRWDAEVLTLQDALRELDDGGHIAGLMPAHAKQMSEEYLQGFADGAFAAPSTPAAEGSRWGREMEEAFAADHVADANNMVLSDAEIEKEAGNRVGGMSYKVGFIEGANFARGRTP